MTKDNYSKKDKRKPNLAVDSSYFNDASSFALKHWQSILTVFGIILGVLLGYTFISNSTNIKNLINVDDDVLRNAIFNSEQPHLFYCSRAKGNSQKEDDAPVIFTELYKIRSSKYTFAAVNCSQMLPSGKNLYDRFKLKKEVRPTIFGSAPWSKVKQALPEHMKSIDALKKFVDASFSPKATLVTSDKELRKHCGSNMKNSTRDSIATNHDDTCIVLLKGSKHNKALAEVEARLVRENPKLKIAMVDATKRRLSFEDPELMPAEAFGLRVHALRNATHYITMVNPVTWDYLSTFVGHSAGSPITAYSGSKLEPISLLKLSSPVFKRKSKSSTSKQSTSSKHASSDHNLDDMDEYDDDIEETSSTPPQGRKPAHRKQRTSSSEKEEEASFDALDDDRSKEGRSKRRQKARDDRDRERQQKSSPSDDHEESPAEKQERERIRREKMERQSRERLFDDDDSISSDHHHDDDEDEIIEL